MDVEFEQFKYCLGDPVFYTRPSEQSDTSPLFEVSLPGSWHTHRDGEWTMHSASESARIPEQGWKVHVSSTMASAPELLQATAGVCQKFDIAFKHLSTVRYLFLRNSKNYQRGHAGKFVTCYPPPEALPSFLDSLEAALSNFTGPYILSDKRWRSAPIYLRYGAFRRLTVSIDGVETPAVRNGDGKLVPDHRGPVFSTPEWAEVPDCLAHWIDSYPDDGVENQTLFNVVNAIKFTNGGGTYNGVMNDDKQARVVVKEARPHAGLDGARRNSIERLSVESRALSELSGTGITPQVRWYGTVWEHDFLCIEHVNGLTLQKWIGRNFPVYHGAGESDYYRRVLDISRELLRAIETVHDAGWTHQDLHPRNVLIESMAPVSLKLIDFEGARSPAATRGAQEFGFPGYRSLRLRTPQETDWHGLRQILSYMVLPLINLSELDEAYTRQTVEFARRRSLSDPEREALQSVVSLIDELARRASCGRAPAVSGGKYPTLSPVVPGRTNAAASLIQAAEEGMRWALGHVPGEALPTDYEGLAEGQHGLAYGAAGVTLALAKSALAKRKDNDRDELFERMISKTRHSLSTAPEAGLFTGAMGDLLALHVAGQSAFVSDFLAKQHEDLLSCAGPRIYDGLPGVLLGMTWLLADGANFDELTRQRLTDEISLLNQRYLVAPNTFSPIGEPGRIMTNQARRQDSGLFYGHLGIAWLLSTAANVFDQPDWAKSARVAIDHELSRYKDENGRIQFEQAGRLLPYLATGSAGLGVVLPLLPLDLVDDSLRDAAQKCLAAVRLDFCAVAGLFNGYAGLMIGAAGLQAALGHQYSMTRNDLAALEIHSLTSGSDRLFGGDSGFRLAIDFATGSAGIIFALSILEQSRHHTSNDDSLLPFEGSDSAHKVPVP